MKPIINNWKKIILIALVSWGIAIGLHRLMPIELTAPLPHSIIVQNNLLLPVAGTSLLLTFIILAAIFVLFQERLPGKKLIKGIGYGLLVSGIWFFGFIETSAILNTSLSTEIYNWLPDGLLLILMGAGLGLFAANDSHPAVETNLRQRLWPALIVAGIFLAGRYFAYAVLDINSPFDPQPWPVLAWTVGLSFWVGVTYFVLGRAAPKGTHLNRSIWFGGLVFGLDWLIVQLFFLIFYQIPALNLLERASSDIFFVSLGVFLAEKVLTNAYATR